MIDIESASKQTELFLDSLGEDSNEVLIKSKQRVAESGEVFTPRNIVKDMLDLEDVKECSFDL